MGLPVEAFPCREDFGPKCSGHGCDLRAGIAVDLHTRGSGNLQYLWHDLLHCRAVEVCRDGCGIDIAFDQTTTFTVGAQNEVVAQRSGLLFADLHRLLCEGLKFRELSVMNVDVDQQAYAR